jgi:uncharacterized protein YkwD
MVLAQLPKRQTTVHEKKRHGRHHKASKHYTKTYWPYLPMLLMVALGFVLNSVLGARSGVLSYATAVDQTSLLQETNIQRSQNGRSALALNSSLQQAAQDKANDMAARNYWSHATPEGKQPWQFISATGYGYTTAGENLAYGFDSSSSAISGWMNSPSHRDNLLSSTFKEVGFGIANNPNFQGDGEQTVIVAMYAAPRATVAAAQAAPKPETPAPAIQKTPVATPAPSTPAQQSLPAETPVAPPVEQSNAAKPPQAALPDPTNVAVALNAQKVSRIDVLTNGNAQWAILAASVLVTIGAISFIYRHGRLWRKYLVRGEHFVIRHPVFDTVMVAVVVVSVVLTRTAGIIH